MCNFLSYFSRFSLASFKTAPKGAAFISFKVINYRGAYAPLNSQGIPVDAAIWGLIGTVIGALSSISKTLLTNRSSYKLERDRMRDERDRMSDERVEQSTALQRESLLTIQDAIHDAIRLVHSAHIEDVMAHRTTKTWGKNMLPEEMN